MVRTLCLLLSLIFSILITSCSENLTDQNSRSELQILLSMKDSKSTKSRYTAHSKVHVSITDEFGTIIKDTAHSSVETLSMLVFEGIPAGKATVTVWTTDEGEIIHTPQSQDVAVLIGEKATLSYVLEPRCGSIIAQLYDIPTAVDSVHFSFVSDSGSFYNKQKRSMSLLMPLDKIPYGAIGTLSLACLRAGGDTLTSWDTLFTFTNSNASVELNLINNGSIDVNIEMKESAIWTISGTGDTTAVLSDEMSQGVFISEFCATGGSSDGKEFIELYNATAETVTLSSAILVIKGTNYTLPEITISGNSCYVIGSEEATPIWDCDMEIDMDLSSTSGTMFLFNDGELIDYVIYFNDYDKGGWPKLSSSSKTSWQLKKEITDPEENNYGTSWQISPTPHKEVDGEQWFGTPGSL